MLELLRRRGVARGEEIQSDLGISQPVMSRLVHQAGSRVCRLGRARASRYALTRELPGVGTRASLYRVDGSGRTDRLGVLHFLARGDHWLEREAGRGQSFDGLPPFADDMRPQGYIGRGFPVTHPDLKLPSRITDWDNDHHLIALARRGEDCVGNLILGEESADRALAAQPSPRARADYPALARGALAGQPGSSAGGEHSKFAAFAEGRHSLVKFAIGDGSAADRWRDLLVCEHVALEVLREAGIPAAKSAWFDSAGDRFLEVERFDRVGRRGRRGVLSLAAVNSHYLGYAPENWGKAARHILAEPTVRLEAGHAERMVWLDTFGDLIANTDRHFGNVSFFAEEAERPLLSLTPAYDMLPMAFAPRGASLPDVTFVPRPPTAMSLPVWGEAARHALRYWDRMCGEDGVSRRFRQTCSDCREEVAKLVRGA